MGEGLSWTGREDCGWVSSRMASWSKSLQIILVIKCRVSCLNKRAKRKPNKQLNQFKQVTKPTLNLRPNSNHPQPKITDDFIVCKQRHKSQLKFTTKTILFSQQSFIFLNHLPTLFLVMSLLLSYSLCLVGVWIILHCGFLLRLLTLLLLFVCLLLLSIVYHLSFTLLLVSHFCQLVRSHLSLSY